MAVDSNAPPMDEPAYNLKLRHVRQGQHYVTLVAEVIQVSPSKRAR